jgi:transcriptional regulator with XRE-family HTH domain
MQANAARDTALLKAHSLHSGIYRRVADKLGIDPSYVSRIARGKRDEPKILRAVLNELHKIQRLLK